MPNRGQRYTAQSRLDKYRIVDTENSKLNVDAVEFVPASAAFVSLSETSEFQDDIDVFTEACMKEVSEHPGDFNIIVSTFIEEFMGFLKNDNSTARFAITITDLCIKNENCRFSGVKLVNLLRKESQKFFFIILTYCQDKYDEIQLKKCDSDFEYLVKFSLFIGELYVQFEESSSRCLDLRKIVVGLCHELLKLNNAASVSTLIRLLKLIGQSLYIDAERELSQIITSLEDVVFTNEFGNEMETQFVSLLKTHKKKWYVEDRHDGDVCEDGFEELEHSTLYGPDGVELSSEESNFLSLCCDENGVNNSN